ncbi:MAG: hypothetical protein R6V12_02820 [Candidatus Hydrogenedentota bacterium]
MMNTTLVRKRRFSLGFLAILLAMGVVAEPVFSAALPIVLEAEEYARKASEDAEFAKPARDRYASGRASLARFFKKGVVFYTFLVENEREYTIWLRYGAKTSPWIGVAIDGGEKPEFDPVQLEPTGGYIGPGVWGWQKLITKRLSVGEHILAVQSAAFRPDCFCIAPEGVEVTDEILSLGPKQVDEATRKLLDVPTRPIRPDWIDVAEDYRIPAWFDAHRVQAHTRLSPRWMEKPIFLDAADAFRSMGCRAFTRHIKSGGEAAWWPSAVGAVLPQVEERNYAKEIINSAHEAGCHIIVYHRHMEDDYMAKQHPEWVCRGPEGQVLSSSRGDYMCFNSPYPDYFLVRALELVDMGADGFYFDEAHMPKSGCWCDYCKQAFEEVTGLDHPEFPDPFDPVWHKLVEFNNATIERTLLKWRKAIHERNPELVMLIGSNTWPTVSDHHLNNRLFRIADSMKTEFNLPARTPASLTYPRPEAGPPLDTELKVSLGYTLARDATDGRPAHVWVHGLVSETGALYAASGVMAHGCIANLDVSENTIPNMMFRPAFELGERVSPYFVDTEPLRWAAIHYAELARNTYGTTPDAAWEKVLYPLHGAYQALHDARLPVGFVTDSQLAEGRLEDYRVVFEPAPELLLPEMRKALKDFRNGGGIVIENNPEWKWHVPEAVEAAREALISRSREVSPRPLFSVNGGPEDLHCVGFRKRNGTQTIIALAPAFTWVHTGRKRGDTDSIREAETQRGSKRVKGVTLTLRMPGGVVHQVLDAVSGVELTPRAKKSGLVMHVPDFSYLALLVIEHEAATS